MDLGPGFVEIVAHGVVDKVSRETRCFTLVALLLLYPDNVQNLDDDDTPENAPDDQDAFESVDLWDFYQPKFIN